MRIIAKSRLDEFARGHPAARPALAAWFHTARQAHWPHLAAVRQTYRHADAVTAGSGRTVTVFNLAGNRFRLVTTIHYNKQTIYILRFMTHAEYSKEQWREHL